MSKEKLQKDIEMLNERFGKDTLLSLATIDGNRPTVRIVDAYFEDGNFYTIVDAKSEKMKQIAQNPLVGVCSTDYFSAHGIASNLGHIYNDENLELANKLKIVFAKWWDNGHSDYNDINTVILQIKLTDAVFFDFETRYVIDFNYELAKDEKILIKQENRNKELISELKEIWLRSVKATHLFLSEDDIIKLIPFVEMGLEQIEVLVVEYSDNIPIGFMGIDGNKLEMLFLDTPFMRKGYGRKLLTQATDELHVEYVDVNEQNPNALAFYKAMNFVQYDRSEVDDQGNNFPILKLKLNK